MLLNSTPAYPRVEKVSASGQKDSPRHAVPDSLYETLSHRQPYQSLMGLLEPHQPFLGLLEPRKPFLSLHSSYPQAV